MDFEASQPTDLDQVAREIQLVNNMEATENVHWYEQSHKKDFKDIPWVPDQKQIRFKLPSGELASSTKVLKDDRKTYGTTNDMIQWFEDVKEDQGVEDLKLDTNLPERLKWAMGSEKLSSIEVDDPVLGIRSKAKCVFVGLVCDHCMILPLAYLYFYIYYDVIYD